MNKKLDEMTTKELVQAYTTLKAQLDNNYDEDLEAELDIIYEVYSARMEEVA